MGLDLYFRVFNSNGKYQEGQYTSTGFVATGRKFSIIHLATRNTEGIDALLNSLVFPRDKNGYAEPLVVDKTLINTMLAILQKEIDISYKNFQVSRTYSGTVVDGKITLSMQPDDYDNDDEYVLNSYWLDRTDKINILYGKILALNNLFESGVEAELVVSY